MDDAKVLRNRAVKETGQRAWMTVSGSILGVVVVGCVCWFGWIYFRDHYYERVSEMRPEVAEGES
jgi:TRAP-type C4-dicarboxylate transport system permease small subunit